MDEIRIGPILPLPLQRRINRITQIQDILNDKHSTSEPNSPTTLQNNVSFDFSINLFLKSIVI